MTTTYTTEQLVKRWEDQRALKNLMGKYAGCLLLNRHREIYEQFWVQDRADVCLGFNSGWYAGAGAVRGYYRAEHERTALVASLLKERFPDQLGDQSAAELFGIGPFQVKPLSCPVIEIAGDGRTAKGLWYCQGAYAKVYTWGPSASWTWGYCAGDFVLTAKGWKLWHLQCLDDVDARCGAPWGQPVTPLPELPEFAELHKFSMPPPNIPGELRQYYSPSRPLTPGPRLPGAYHNFEDTFSYGAEVAL